MPGGNLDFIVFSNETNLNSIFGFLRAIVTVPTEENLSLSLILLLIILSKRI
jgi:hypothetical protein